jgi:outer membrane protein OmpA-like peptidoglycan-associated protein
MSRFRFGIVILAVLVADCGRTPAPQMPAPAPRDLVVLVADPESVAVGHLTVATRAGRVELTRAGESTTVPSGQAPGAVVVLGDTEIQRIFGAALAVIPEAARRVNLYFHLGGVDLTPESSTLLDEVIALVSTRVAPEVSVIGHADTTGTAEFNMALGLKRALLLRDLLIEAGLDADLIDVVSHGDRDLLVPTPDDTPEPRNRRVEVTVR